MNVEIGAEAALFPGKEYIKGIFVAVLLQEKTPDFCFQRVSKTQVWTFAASSNSYGSMPNCDYTVIFSGQRNLAGTFAAKILERGCTDVQVSQFRDNWCGGGHTRWQERGMGGQNFGRRQTQLCTLHMCKYFVGPDKTKRKSEKFTVHQHQFWMNRRRRTYGTQAVPAIGGFNFLLFLEFQQESNGE